MGPARLAGGRRVLGAAAILAILAMVSCAHERRVDERRATPPSPPGARKGSAPPGGQATAPPPPLNRRSMMSIADAGYESWIAGVRACTAADAAGAKPNVSGTEADLAKRRPAVSIEGRLVPANAECTLMECGGGCCNQCSVDWVLVPRRHEAGRTLSVNLRGTSVSLKGGAMDCAVRGYAQEADWVIVSGRVGGKGDVVLDAELCRLQSSATRDGLTDADYKRLTKGARPSR